MRHIKSGGLWLALRGTGPYWAGPGLAAPGRALVCRRRHQPQQPSVIKHSCAPDYVSTSISEINPATTTTTTTTQLCCVETRIHSGEWLATRGRHTLVGQWLSWTDRQTDGRTSTLAPPGDARRKPRRRRKLISVAAAVDAAAVAGCAPTMSSAGSPAADQKSH